MKETEARELLGMVKASTTQFSLDDETVAFWLDALSPLDAELATKAVLIGIKTWERFPPWAEFTQIYQMLRRTAESDSRRQQIGEQGKYGSATPEWVWVWSWARWHRDPTEERPFPQQRDHVDPMAMMSQQEYDSLRDEWVALGSPKEANPIPLSLAKD